VSPQDRSPCRAELIDRVHAHKNLFWNGGGGSLYQMLIPIRSSIQHRVNESNHLNLNAGFGDD
jgi:hypothetical protein